MPKLNDMAVNHNIDHEFTYPYSPRKFLHSVKDETFQQGNHELTGMQQLSEQVVRYDLDDMDVCWLRRANEEREATGEILIDEWVMETVIEGLEAQVGSCTSFKETKAKQKRKVFNFSWNWSISSLTL